MKIELILGNLLTVVNQLQVTHWNTHKHTEHQYTDQALEEIAPKVDEFVEVFQGKFGKRLSPSGTLSIVVKQDFEIGELVDKVKEVKSIMSRNAEFDNDELCDILDDISKSLSILKFHLSLD